MIINLSSEYKIITDDMQFVVQKMNIIQKGKTTKDENVGKENWTNIGYFPKLNQSIQFVSKHILLTNDDLSTIIDKLNNIELQLKGMNTMLELRSK